jgi:hypothetical protein
MANNAALRQKDKLILGGGLWKSYNDRPDKNSIPSDAAMVSEAAV